MKNIVTLFVTITSVALHAYSAEPKLISEFSDLHYEFATYFSMGEYEPHYSGDLDNDGAIETMVFMSRKGGPEIDFSKSKDNGYVGESVKLPWDFSQDKYLNATYKIYTYDFDKDNIPELIVSRETKDDDDIDVVVLKLNGSRADLTQPWLKGLTGWLTPIRAFRSWGDWYVQDNIIYMRCVNGQYTPYIYIHDKFRLIETE